MESFEIKRHDTDIVLLDDPGENIERIEAGLIANANDVGTAKPVLLQVVSNGAGERPTLADHRDRRMADGVEPEGRRAECEHRLGLDRPHALTVRTEHGDIMLASSLQQATG